MKKTRYRVTYIDYADCNDEYHFYCDNKQRAIEHAKQFIGRRGEVTVIALQERTIFQTSALENNYE